MTEDATSHIIENKDGSFDIDIFNADTQEKKFKEGDLILFKDDKGHQHIGIVGRDKGDEIHTVWLRFFKNNY